MPAARLEVARLYADSIRAREVAVKEFENLPQETRTVILLDLASSSTHRLLRGTKKAYERTMTFYSLVTRAFSIGEPISILKEMGDGILAIGRDPFACLISCLLIKSVERMIRVEFEDNLIPFRIRIGLGFGELRRIGGNRVDYLGATIDELVRITTDRRYDDGVLVSDAYLNQIQNDVSRAEFINIGEMEVWRDHNSSLLKQSHITYYPIFWDVERFLDTFEIR